MKSCRQADLMLDAVRLTQERRAQTIIDDGLRTLMLEAVRLTQDRITQRASFNKELPKRLI